MLTDRANVAWHRRFCEYVDAIVKNDLSGIADETLDLDETDETFHHPSVLPPPDPFDNTEQFIANVEQHRLQVWVLYDIESHD